MATPSVPTFVPFRFNPVNDAMLLKAAGYVHEFIPAEWWDAGGPESGPRLEGHPDMDVFYLDTRDGGCHEIVVVDGMVVETGYGPIGPEGWDEQF